MREDAIFADPRALWPPKGSLIQRIARQAVLNRIMQIDRGKIIFIEGLQKIVCGEVNDEFPIHADVTIHDPRFWSSVAFGGSVGAGTAYMKSYWSCDNLTDLVRIFVLNREILNRMERGTARLISAVNRIHHFMRRNTRRGSRDNISAHYDLSNDFFELFLDESMMYSSAIFDHDRSTLEEASRAKIDTICRKLELAPGDHLLEIGSGWGGFAVHAAKHYGCRVTTTTISSQQYELARRRIHDAGLENRITLLREDYRDLHGRFDKLVSIEMIEAVGRSFMDTYFQKCSELLKPDGMMLLQAIVIADQYYEQAGRSIDFIQRYIFPGSFIPSISAMTDAIKKNTDLKLFHLDDIGPHYARTLKVWRKRFLANLDRVRALGYSEEFIRMWEFYLCYCEGGFLERQLGDVQMLLTKPLCRRTPILTS